MILGLDISTSITGLAVVDKDLNLVYNNHVDLRKEENIFSKAGKVKNMLLEIKKKFNITKITIEQPFTFFNSGGSSAKTMAMLQRFNGMISWITVEVFSTEPSYITASEARRLCGVKVNRGENAKENALKAVVDMYPNFEVEWTKQNNPKPGYYDRADGVVIAKAGAIQCLIQKN
jgi:RNase H-fold protein (predicted Holliday junction resolvase)